LKSKPKTENRASEKRRKSPSEISISFDLSGVIEKVYSRLTPEQIETLNNKT
jgi:hypothetical protein